MAKRDLSIASIAIVVTLFLITAGALTKARKEKLEEATLTTPTPTPSPSATPTSLPPPPPQAKQPAVSAKLQPLPISPRPSPTPFQFEGTFPVIISENDLNNLLTELFVIPTQSSNNPVTKAKITLQEGIGLLEADWQQGQRLTGEIRVAADRKTLTVQNIQVAGAGALEGLFEKIAYDILNAVVNQFITDQQNLEKIEAKPGQLILRYRI